MAQKAFIATVQVIIKPGAVEDDIQARDWFHGLLSGHSDILDWGFVRIGGQYLYPAEKTISASYEEGDGLEG